MSKLMVKDGDIWVPMEGLKGDTGPLPEDESIPDTALVTDGAKTNTAYLMRNRLTKDVEGEVITVEDSYSSAALSLTVDGKSTQLTTTGKNLLSDQPEDYVVAVVGGDTQRYFAISAEAGAKYTYHRASKGYGFYIAWADSLDSPITVYDSVTMTNRGSYTFTNSNNHAYLVVYYSTSYTAAEWVASVNTNQYHIEKGSEFTSYEPYSGGAASPRPDWPQEIESVDWPSTHITGKNLLGGDDFKAALSKDSRININEENHYASYGASGGSVNLFDGVKFKETTAYTIILAVLCTRENTPCNLRIGYTDNTYISMAAPQFFDGETMQIFKFTSNASKTIKGLYRQNNGGTTFIYYDYWGIFEGDADVDSYELYTGAIGSLLPEGTSLRSLPDSTKDELHLTYLRPSDRPGWAWYSRELVKKVGKTLVANHSWPMYTSTVFRSALSNQCRVTSGGKIEFMSSQLAPYRTVTLGGAGSKTPANSIFGRQDVHDVVIHTSNSFDTTADFVAACGDMDIQYPLAAPETIQLDPIELPIMQSGVTNLWSDPSTNLSVTYERDRNIVIANLKAAVADLTTS